ncbi:MAG: acyl-CoA thioesterase [Cyanobium sp. M30B3]|jgi:acyl-CoA thioester hydrolase|nr:MAG: acyl-CoA thioesterase [Cyanobium sp. M30B3]
MQTVMECGQWTLRRRVLPQHTDHAGVMWHGAYLAWLEEARVEALAGVGLAYGDLSARGLELPVVGLTLQYLQPLRHGDVVDVVSRVLPRTGLKLTWHSRFVSAEEGLAAEARVDLVLVDRHAQAMAAAGGGPVFRLRRRWPDDLAAAATALAQGRG